MCSRAPRRPADVISAAPASIYDRFDTVDQASRRFRCFSRTAMTAPKTTVSAERESTSVCAQEPKSQDGPQAS